MGLEPIPLNADWFDILAVFLAGLNCAAAFFLYKNDEQLLASSSAILSTTLLLSTFLS